MDRRTIIAVVLSIVLLIVWRPLLKVAGLGRYVESPRRAAIVHDSTLAGSAPVSGGAPAVADTTEKGSNAIFVTPPDTSLALARSIDLETKLYRASFSTRGARLVSFELKRYAAAHGVSSKDGAPTPIKHGAEILAGDRVVLAGGPLVALDLGSGSQLRSLERLSFAVADSVDAEKERVALTFTARTPEGVEVRETYRVRADNYALDLDVSIHGMSPEIRISDYSVTTRSWPLLTEADPVSDGQALRASSLVGANLHRDMGRSLLKGPRTVEGNVAWAAVQTRYFVSAVAIRDAAPRGSTAYAERRPVPEATLRTLPRGASAEQVEIVSGLVLGLPTDAKPVHRLVVYAGPSQYFALASLGLQLERAVDLGWNWIRPFSTLLLRVLNWFYGWLQNYGVAIIALATLVRLLLHPLNMSSMRNMRSMQKLQPEMERVRAKYKDDPQGLNTAVMALYKEHKVNPAGGCLPMVVQMPFFIALYQVLFNAIELRQAPFVGWITDLSAPDHLFSVGPFPIHVLPILMTLSGLLSFKLTPQDPRQAPTMMMMNVVMLVFFYRLPSGLVLYWTVMNLLTALQQWLLIVQDKSTVSVAEVVPDREAGSKRRKAPARS